MRVILSGVSEPYHCRLFVIDLHDNEIRFFSPDQYRPIVWANPDPAVRGTPRTPKMQGRLTRAYDLREAGLSYLAIGKVMRVSGARAQQLVARAQKERAAECPPPIEGV